MTVHEQEYLDAMARAVAAEVVAQMGGPRDDRPLLTLEEVLGRLKISDRSLRKLIKEDKVLATVTVGDGSIRIEERELDRYLATLREVATT